jgi:chromosomal replication initiation ATPase DnaA
MSALKQFPHQLALPLRVTSPFENKPFLKFSCHQEALTWFDSFPSWPLRFLCIHGPHGSGKTHLAHLFQQKSNAFYIPPTYTSNHSPMDWINQAVILDDVDQIDDNEWLFHFFNAMKESFVLFCSQKPPSQWPLIWLPDLISRLSTLACVEISQPDDDSMGSLLHHLMDEQGIEISKEANDFLLKRIDRSFDAIHHMAKVLHYYALSYRKQTITLPFVKMMLDIVDPLMTG